MRLFLFWKMPDTESADDNINQHSIFAFLEGCVQRERIFHQKSITNTKDLTRDATKKKNQTTQTHTHTKFLEDFQIAFRLYTYI